MIERSGKLENWRSSEMEKNIERENFFRSHVHVREQGVEGSGKKRNKDGEKEVVMMAREGGEGMRKEDV